MYKSGVLELSLTNDTVEAIKRIVRIDVTKLDKLTPKQAEIISNKLSTFIVNRTPQDYSRFMQFYRLHTLVASSDTFSKLAESIRVALEDCADARFIIRLVP